ncbi:recombinase family protein [Luxibacter massiliensis]|uniref:recombinase family protein n=1 Tax=Luxibacter massiliensis TaxID=2219695 RepID=UPI0013DF7DBC|nr:recombinase family protein [Luxibacter massiliensis]
MSEVRTRKFGYIRVSSKDQHIDRQLSDFKREGIQKRDIFIEKQSGRDFQRPVYRQIGNRRLYRLSFLWVHPQHLLVQQGMIGCNHLDNFSALP